MTSFEVGFIKYATEYGLSDTHAAHILKRALDHSEVQSIFKTLPHTEQEPGEDLDELQNMLGLDTIDRQMNIAGQKLSTA